MVSQVPEPSGNDRHHVTPSGSAVHVPKAAELIAQTIRRQIISGELREGDSLPHESALTSRFGVSRPTLREAIRILESESLVTINRGRIGGTRIHVPTGDLVSRYASIVLQYRDTSVRDVFRARSIFEPACVKMVAEGRSNKDLTLLRSALAREESAPENVHDLRAISGFHRAVVQVSRNETLILMSELIRHILIYVTAADMPNTTMRVQVMGEHRALLTLIEARDGLAAEAHWRTHLATGEKRVLARIGARRTVRELIG
jgi:DNA-binding FadR family transcriptional regulator